MHPAPSVWDWVQMIVLIIAVVGGAALVGWLGGVVPAIVMVVIIVALLFFSVAYKLQGRLDVIDSRRPMTALRRDSDQGYQRLIVKNPNAFAVKGVYVQLEELVLIEAVRADFARPSFGFRFPWASWATEGGSLFMDFPAGAEVPVDIAAKPPWAKMEVDGHDCFFFVHLADDKEKPVRATYLQTTGKYELTLQLCSEDLPAGSATVMVEYSGESGLAMQLAGGE
jgi:hypothetical protein